LPEEAAAAAGQTGGFFNEDFILEKDHLGLTGGLFCKVAFALDWA
jgi:hypothetical protein